MIKPILIVDDDHLQREMLATLMRRRLDLGAHTAENGQKALEFLEKDADKYVKLVILDLDMPVMSGLETLEILGAKYPSIPVIMLTGSKDIDDAVAAMKLGAVDFLTKPCEAERMAVTVKNALKLSILSKEVARLKNEKDGTFGFENLIGYDNGLSSFVNIGRKAAQADIPVLITGETGTGKEVFAKAIHGDGLRAGHPFIAVNCGAIPSQLVESTLFGHEKGAFTGATEKTIGKFREANGGTIFLDEVGELPLDTQVKLLRVLQQKEVEPVGANRPVPVNIRIISATNRDLEKEVKDGHFREDLFFRLNVLQVEMPPLRERTQDIPALIHHFIERFSINHGGVPKDIPETLVKKLTAYDWPGNVRQLENTIQRAIVMSDGNTLDVESLSQIIDQPIAENYDRKDVSTHSSIQVISNDGLFRTVYEIEQIAMQMALDHFDRNITRASEALGIAKSTFYKKMQKM